MELNITIGVQIINFLVAWLLLHTLYFKPAIQYLSDKQKKYDQLLNMLYHWQTSITQEEHKIDLAWRKLTLFSKQHKPDVTYKPEVPESIESPLGSIVTEHQEVQILAQEIKDLIVKEALDVEL